MKLMKKKYITILLGTALALSLLHGCGGKKGIEKIPDFFQGEEQANAIYGQVSGKSENGITIEIGTRNERKPGQQEDMPRNESRNEAKEDAQPEGEAKEPPSMLELTGEEQEIEVTEDTVIKRFAMGGKMRGGEEPPSGASEQEVPSKELGRGVPSGEFPGGSEEQEELEISDISKGDTIMVVLAEDGSAKEITVLSGMGSGDRTENSEEVVMSEDEQAENPI